MKKIIRFIICFFGHGNNPSNWIETRNGHVCKKCGRKTA